MHCGQQLLPLLLLRLDYDNLITQMVYTMNQTTGHIARQTQWSWTSSMITQPRYLDITDVQILFQNGQSLVFKFSSRKTTFDCAVLRSCRLWAEITDGISAVTARHCRTSTHTGCTSNTWRYVPALYNYYVTDYTQSAIADYIFICASITRKMINV